MKTIYKYIIGLIFVLLIVFLLISSLTKTGKKGIDSEYENVYDTISVNIKKEEVIKIDKYINKEIFYIALYENETSKKVIVLNDKFDIIDEIVFGDIYLESEIKAKIKSLYDKIRVSYGYEEKLIFEIETIRNDEQKYFYFDALTGELMNEISFK